MDKIIGIGNALVDVLAKLQDDELLQEHNLPKGGMTLIDEERQPAITASMKPLKVQRATGGSAGNTVLALANLGAAPGFIGRIGRDEFGDFLRQTYQRIGIDARLLMADNHTGVANTFISRDGERTFATCLGAAALMDSSQIKPELLSGYQILYIEGYLVQNHELIETVARLAKSAGMKLAIDLASYNVVASDQAFFRHLVKEYIDIVFANEEESAAFTDKKDARKALNEIAEMCQIAIVKLGSRGASAKYHEGDPVIVPAHKVEVVDTTAAGDFFAGGFLYAFSQGATLEKCLRCGGLLGEYIIQVVGTQLSPEKWQEIREKVDDILK